LISPLILFNDTVQRQQPSTKLQLPQNSKTFQNSNKIPTWFTESTMRSVYKVRILCGVFVCSPTQHSGAVKIGVPGDLWTSSSPSCKQTPWFSALNKKLKSKV
jgi:hypothetical protein